MRYQFLRICACYILFHSQCSVIWHNCNESDKQKLERLNVRALEGVSTL